MRKDTGINEFRRKIYIASISTIIGVILIVVGFTIYSKSLNNNAKQSALDTQKIAELVPSEDDLESASTEFGKTVEQSEEESKNSNESGRKSEATIELGANTNTSTETKDTQTNNKSQTQNKSDTTNSINQTNNTTKANTNATSKTTQKVEEQKEEKTKPETETEAKNPTFIAPVEGEIIKEFATDTLVYSATLEEWITHNGIDIKAEKTSIVKAAADGTVKTIKNDPRYGLTVIIEHDNGFKTVYANLLTSEFVSEGEKVKSGQTIGTVGNTATFEIADETHLHFEMIKDNKYVDPGVYMK